MKNRMRFLGRGALIAGVVCAVGVGIDATASSANAAGGFFFCPAVYDPVICDDGNVYSNQCYADLAGATGCERLFPPIPPIEAE